MPISSVDDTPKRPDAGPELPRPCARLRALLDEGIASAGRGQFERARRAFEAVLADDHENEDAWLWLAAMTEDHGLARAIYGRVLATHPQSLRARDALRYLDQVARSAGPLRAPAPIAEPPATVVAPPSEVAAAPLPPSPATDERAGPDLFVPPWERDVPIPILEPSTPALPAEAARSVEEAPALPVEPAGPEKEAPLLTALPPKEEAPPAAISELPDDLPAIGSAAMNPTPGEPEELGESASPADALSPEETYVSDNRETRRKSLPEAGPSSGPSSAQPVAGPAAPPTLPAAPRRRAGAAGLVATLSQSFMLAMVGFVLIGSLALILVLGNQSHAERLRVALGVLTETPTVTATATATPTPVWTATPTVTATPVSSATPSPTITNTPAPTLTPDWLTAKYLPLPTDEKWIEVDLSEQKLTAYEGTTVVYTATVSSGKGHTPTVLGKFRIQRKLESQLMAGPGYYLPGVPHVMYFYAGYALHGAYWHNKWGTPTSHGCVNLKREDAKWLYEWTGPTVPAGAKTVASSNANPGTWVIVHQ